jgi:hypothetical protein
MKLAVLLLTTFSVGCATGAAADGEDSGPERGPRVDASEDTPDSAATPDAGIDAAGIDATTVSLDATPACTDMWIELLKNPSFESGKSSWPESTLATCGGVKCPLVQQFGAGREVSFAAQTPTWAVWLGGYETANDLLSQANLDVPDDAKSLRVTGYACVESYETTANVDTMEIRLRKGTTVVETPVSLSGHSFDPTCTWTSFTAMATASHAGETLEVQVNARTNNDTQNTNFFVDTLSVAALVCR